MGKKYISSPLCATYSTFHRISTSPFPSPPPLSFLSIIRLLPFFFRFVHCSSSHEPGMLLQRSHKELRFQPLSRRMALGGVCSGGGVWGYFKSGFLMLLSCKNPSSPSFFFTIQPSCLLLSLRATVVAGVAVGC